MNADLLAEALRLNPDDRLRLIEALWDTLSEEDIPLAREERALLDARLADLEANPKDQSPWPEEPVSNSGLVDAPRLLPSSGRARRRFSLTGA